MNQHIGKQAEEKALQFLLNQGLQFVAQNYNCPLGEIDLIMRDKSHFVFVEVRYRTHASFGDGIQSITAHKKRKIMKAASHYLIQSKIKEEFPLRFDVISMDGQRGLITWLKDAFGVNY